MKNMQKTLLWLLAAALLLTGCARGAQEPAPAPAPTPVVQSMNELGAQEPSTQSVGTPTPQAAPDAAGTIEQKLAAMAPVLDSIVRTMGVEGEVAYAPNDPLFVWSALYLVGVNWGEPQPPVQREGADVLVPRQTMEAYAAAAFAGLAALPPVPEEMKDALHYDEARGAYRLAASDMGEAETELLTYALEPDGRVSALVRLSYGDTELGGLRFTLVENGGGLADPVFAYSVASAARESGHSPLWQPVELNTPVEADLNGDGKYETVTVKTTAEDGAQLTIAYGGERYSEDFPYLSYPSCHVGDTLAGDGSVELFLCGDSGSCDYETHIYRVTESGVQHETLDGTVLYADGSGVLPLEMQLNALGSYGGLCDYTLADGLALGFARSSDYAACRGGDAWSHRALTLKRDGLPATLENGAPLVLNAGESLLLLRTDAERYALCELADGRRVRVALERPDGDWQIYIDGTPESDWFTELFYAG